MSGRARGSPGWTAARRCGARSLWRSSGTPWPRRYAEIGNPVLLGQKSRHIPGMPGGLELPGHRGDDRAEQQHLDLKRKGIGIGGPGFLGQAADEGSDVLEARGCRGANRALSVAGLEQRPREQAAFVVVPLEPLVEGVEEPQQPSAGRRAAAPDLLLEP